MKIIDFLRDLGIEFITGNHKHAQSGWVNFRCPFCTGNPGYHLGYKLDPGFFSCWRCGGHSELEVIKEFHRCNWTEAKKIAARYGGETYMEAPKKIRHADELKFPEGCGPLTNKHLQYLSNRFYDPEEVAHTWDLQGTGRRGSYSNRIIAPIFYFGQLVSYQGRDITDSHELKYKACRKEEEVLDHKHTLYGQDLAKGRSVVIVEGITDVWRLGPGSVATFGIKFTPQQVALMRRWDNRFILFDDDPEATAARDRADKLYYLLSGFPGHTEIIELEPQYDKKGNHVPLDPGDLDQDDADAIMHELVGK